MTTIAVRPPARVGRRAVSHGEGSRALDVLLFTTMFFVTFAKVRITPGGENHLVLSDVTATLFVLGFLAYRIGRRDFSVSRTAALTGLFVLAFLLVFLIGFFNIATEVDRNLLLKGIGKRSIHFALLFCGVAYLGRRSVRVYWQALGAFVAGIAANAAYGILQLVLAETSGANLDELLLGRLGIYDGSQINRFGAVGGAEVYRTNALTLDPNHLAVILVVPILVLLPLYLRLERGHAARTPLAVLLGFLALVQLSTLSRSGLLGLAAGLLVLAIPYRHLLTRPRALVPLAALGLVLLLVVASRADFYGTVVSARTQVGGSSAETHLAFYSLIRPALEQHLLFGLGHNTFAGYYELLTGSENYGPHSFWVAVLTETGVVGTTLYAAWLVFLFSRLSGLRRLGRRLAQAGDALEARVRPLGWGLTAALVGTMAANLFYLTMTMYYFVSFALLLLAAPVVFGRAAARWAGTADTVRR